MFVFISVSLHSLSDERRRANAFARGRGKQDDLGQTSNDLVCFGSTCVSWADAFARGSGRGWRASLPPMETDINATCRIQGQLSCKDMPSGTVCARREQQKCSDLLELRPDFDGGAGPSACDPSSGRNRGSVLSVHLAWPPPKPPPSALLQSALSFTTDPSADRMNWVPVLLQEVAAQGGGRIGNIAGVPCSSARLEDGAVFRSFFVASDGRPLGGGTFLEMGAYDGATESTSAFYEQCLGWRGILIEAQPKSFTKVLKNRPSALNIRVAACPAHGSVQFSGDANSYSRIGGNGTDGSVGVLQTKDGTPPVSVTCGPIGDYLTLLGVTRLDYFSLDVEGSEPEVIESLRTAQGLSIGVFQVEVRGDGRRGEVMRTLMRHGFSYVGQMRGKPSVANEIIDDVYVNMSHMARFYPQSCAFAVAGKEPVRSAARNVTTFQEQLTRMKRFTKRCCPTLPGSCGCATAS